jgi:5-methylcytosine-specific restriction enzyme A
MAKPWAKKFYASKAWKLCRESYIAKVHGLCERCEGAGKILHHTIYLTPDNINDPNISLNHDVLEFLCAECHNIEHHEKHSPTMWGIVFDSNGNPVRREDLPS